MFKIIKPNALKIYEGNRFYCIVYEVVRNGKKFYEKLKIIEFLRNCEQRGEI